MTQYARPASDITIGNWTDEGTSFNDGNLYTSIQEVTQDGDTSYINADDTATTCEVKLSSINTPGAGTITLHVYFRSSGSGGPEKLDIDVVEGTTVIQSWANQSNRSGTYLDLNAAITNSISDWTDVRVRLGADSVGSGEYIRVTQVYIDAPDGAGGSSSDSQPAFMAGSDTSSDNQISYLAGQDTSLDNQTGFLKGSDDALDNQLAFLIGSLTSNDNQIAFLAGLDTNLDNQAGFLAGKDTGLDNQTGYLKGQDTSSDNQLAFLEGGTGSTTDPAISWAFVSIPPSEPLSANDNQAAFTYGQVAVSDSQAAFLSGQDTSLDQQPGYTKGQNSNFDNQIAFLAGLDNALDNQPAFTDGQDTDSSSTSAFLGGILGASDSTPAFLAGPTQSSHPAYTRGGEETSDNQPAYTKGGTGTSGSTDAFTKGQVEVTDNQVAYTEGYSASVTTSQDAFIRGQDTAESSQSAFVSAFPKQPAFLRGADTASDNQIAFVRGYYHPTDYQPAYLFSANDDGDTTTAFTSGAIFSSDNIPAFCSSGEQSAISSTHAFLKAHYSSSTPAFITGEIVAVDYGMITSEDGTLSFKFRVLSEGYSDGTLMKGVHLRKTVGGSYDINNTSIYRVWEPVIKVRHTETKEGYGTLANLEALYEYYGNVTWRNHYQQEFRTLLIGNFEKAMLTAAVEGNTAWYIVKLTLLEVQ